MLDELNKYLFAIIEQVWQYNSMIEITLTKGKVALIDDEDLEIISFTKWKFDRYARANVWNKELKKYEQKSMHRVIMNAPKGLDVDHINGDKLDNRKINLRICTRSDNLHNLTKNARTPTGLRGAFKAKGTRRWFSAISVKGKIIRLGRFDTPEEAHLAYVTAHKKYYPHIVVYK